MKIINLLILLLAIPPAILSTIQLLDTTLPVVSPIYDSFVRNTTDKVIEVTQGRVASKAAPSASADQAPMDGEGDSSLRWVHLAVAAVSILVALIMFLSLRGGRRARA